MLEHARSGDCAVFGDMADEQKRKRALLRHADECRSDLAHLARLTRQPVDAAARDRLHGIDDQQIGIHRLDLTEHGRQVSLGGEEQVVVECSGALSAQPHLADGLLSAHVEHARLRASATCCHLEQKR